MVSLHSWPRPGIQMGSKISWLEIQLCVIGLWLQWEKLQMTTSERRKIFCSVTFHVIAITCVVWSLYVLIDRTAEEIKQGNDNGKSLSPFSFWLESWDITQVCTVELFPRAPVHSSTCTGSWVSSSSLTDEYSDRKALTKVRFIKSTLSGEKSIDATHHFKLFRSW